MEGFFSENLWQKINAVQILPIGKAKPQPQVGQFICQEQEEKPTIALEKFIRVGKRLESTTTASEVEFAGYFGEQIVNPSIQGGQLIIGSEHVFFWSTKIMFFHRPGMKNENNVG